VYKRQGIDSEIAIAREQIKLYHSYLSDIDLLVKTPLPKQVSSALYQQELVDFKVGINKLQRSFEKQKMDFERTQQLYKEGVVPIVELQEDSFKLKATEDELLVLQTKTLAKWELDKKNYTISTHQLNIKIENLLQQKSWYVITAPYDGSIIEFNGIAVGSMVNENDVIAMLSPEEDLLAECYVSPADIGLIHKKMPIRIQVDAYNYNQWGLMEGIVIDIANDVTEVNGQFVYVVKSQMKSNHLILSNGLKGYLKKGMSMTGRFIVTQRSLFQLLFDNINDWLNPKIIQPESMP
jgi:HlyD family secretion protein